MSTPKGWNEQAERLKQFTMYDYIDAAEEGFKHIDWCAAESETPYMGENCSCPSSYDE